MGVGGVEISLDGRTVDGGLTIAIPGFALRALCGNNTIRLFVVRFSERSSSQCQDPQTKRRRGTQMCCKSDDDRICLVQKFIPRKVLRTVAEKRQISRIQRYPYRVESR